MHLDTAMRGNVNSQFAAQRALLRGTRLRCCRAGQSKSTWRTQWSRLLLMVLRDALLAWHWLLTSQVCAGRVCLQLVCELKIWRMTHNFVWCAIEPDMRVPGHKFLVSSMTLTKSM